jgi:GDPmannose 4,6-dehydratase
MKALICGIGGQDGSYLAKLLVDKGYEVWGTSRDANVATFRGLDVLGIREKVRLTSMAVNDFRSVLQAIARVEPDELYNLSGQSSVGLSFEQPVETLESITVGTINLLEAIRFQGAPIRFYNAASSECFGDTSGLAADETTPFHPRSPYAVAKSAAFWAVANYREAYRLHASSGILFNHESPLRPARFVTRKVVAAACRIANGSGETLHLGNLAVVRDWGWAPEYVDAMWRILNAPEPEDYVVATGESHPLEAFVKAAFAEVSLDWKDHVVADPSLFRPTDLHEGRANPTKAREKLGWVARYRMHDVVKDMVAAEQQATKRTDTLPVANA